VRHVRIPRIRELVRRDRTGGSDRLLRRAHFDAVEPAKALLRAYWKKSEVEVVTVRPGIHDAQVVLLLVVRDEAPRVPHFLTYYRRLGVEHFIVIDNGSSDGLQNLLRDEQDVSVFSARGAYKDSRYGCDWANHICRRYCRGKWVLWVDADEFLVFTSSSEADLSGLAAAMDRRALRSIQVLLLDMYSASNPRDNLVEWNTDPLTVCNLYDRSGYHRRREARSNTTWIKGGVRGRAFFAHVRDSPALNKTTMIRWRRHYLFIKSTHQLWPRSLNGPGESVGAFLHFKFTSSAVSRTVDPVIKGQHTAEYDSYVGIDHTNLVLPGVTERYTDPGSLVAHGLMTPIV
jgi:hypothetical protein